MRRCALALLACLVAGGAAAKQVKVGPVPVDLPAPQGYCELESTQAADGRLITAIESMLTITGNRLLAFSADCGELRDWRAGRRQLLDHMAQYQTVIRLETEPLTGPADVVISETCKAMRAKGEQILSGIVPNAKARAEEVLKTVKLNEMKFLGVVAEEPLVCYAALLQKFRTQAGTEKTQVAVFATKVVNGKLIYFYLFAPFVDGDTVAKMLAELRVNVGRLNAANPE